MNAEQTNIVPWENSGGVETYGKYAADKGNVKERATPILHVVQNNSPEFAEMKTAQPGELVMRIGGKDNTDNPNLGSKFQGIVVARGMEYVWWGDRDSGEGIKARCKPGDPIPNGCDGKDILWPREGGNERQDGKDGPVADLTRTFIVCLFDGKDVKDPMMVAFSRGSAKVGQQLNMLLNRFQGPEYAAILNFATEGAKSKDGKPYFVLKAKPAGALPPSNTVLLDKLKSWHDALAPMFATDAE